MTCDILPEFYSWKEPIASKAHVCCECGVPIIRGEKHFVGTGKWDGELQSYRQHLVCMEACMLIRDKFNDYECIPFGELEEWFGEMRLGWLSGSDSEEWKWLRHLMAVILVRKRNHERSKTMV